jgi:uncharacterized cupredoxin-like copper-binding protein
MRAAIMLASVAAVAFALTGCGGGAQAGADATIGIHFSRFKPEHIKAVAGTPLTLTLRNDDPIEHEWIVGDDEVHARHRTGTEPYHDSRPTEVTIQAFQSRETTVRFDEPGVYEYICHLPGHEAYGMKGTITVTAPE